MRVFIKKILFFSISFLILNFIGFKIVYEKYLGPYELEVNFKCKNFILGDSQGRAVGTKGEKFGVFNFSANSDSYQDIYRKLTFLNESGEEIDTVFLSVNDHTLSEYREKRNNQDRSLFFEVKDGVFSEFKYLAFNRFLVLTNSKYRDVIKLSLEKCEKEEIGRVWADFDSTKRVEQAKKRLNNQFTKHKKSNLMKTYLMKIYDLCENGNIQLVAVKFPISKELNELKGELSFFADSLLLKNGCKMIDLSRSLSNKPSLFKDADHVNEKGANWFWRLFNFERRKLLKYN